MLRNSEFSINHQSSKAVFSLADLQFAHLKSAIHFYKIYIYSKLHKRFSNILSG